MKLWFLGHVGLVAIGLLTLAACSPGGAAAPQDPYPAAAAGAAPTATDAGYPAPAAALPTKPADAVFQLIRPDGSIVNFTMADLKKLPLTSIMVGAKAEEGPALLEVLKAAGVADFKQVTVSGDGTVTLTKEQITPQVVLDFSNRGTVKIASPDLPIPSPAKDLTLIKVE